MAELRWSYEDLADGLAAGLASAEKRDAEANAGDDDETGAASA